MTTTTIETVTKSQIRSLRAEALLAGDSMQVELCDTALGRWTVEYHGEGQLAVIDAAVAACVEAIQSAEAQAE